MNTKTYTIIYESISDYKNKYRNDERCVLYEATTLRWIKNASIIGSITHEEAIALYHHAFN